MTPEQATALGRQSHVHSGLTLEARSELLSAEENVELFDTPMRLQADVLVTRAEVLPVEQLEEAS